MTYREQAIEALRLARDAAGGWTNIARPLGISPQAVAQWEIVPADRVLAVEKATGVSRHKLRPDVFGEMPQAAA